MSGAVGAGSTSDAVGVGGTGTTSGGPSVLVRRVVALVLAVLV